MDRDKLRHTERVIRRNTYNNILIVLTSLKYLILARITVKTLLTNI